MNQRIPHYALNASGNRVNRYLDSGIPEELQISEFVKTPVTRLALIDRDGVINLKPPKHTYIKKPEEIEVLDRVGSAIKILNNAGIPAMVISNQPGIYKKLYSIPELLGIDAEMDRQMHLQAEYPRIDAVFFCPHPAPGEGDEVNESELCTCRKPKPGMLELAMRIYPCNKPEVFMLGDFFSDYEAAENAGCSFIYIDAQSDEQQDNREKFAKAGIHPLTFSSLYNAAVFLAE